MGKKIIITTEAMKRNEDFLEGFNTALDELEMTIIDVIMQAKTSIVRETLSAVIEEIRRKRGE